MTSDRPSPEFGLVLTATEIEGCSPASDWSRWIIKGRTPDSDRGGASTPFARSWAEDLEQLAGLGATTVGITLEWAELEPFPGDHPPGAIEFRRDVLTKASDLGLAPWAYLVDRTLPGWFADDEGGFDDDRSRKLLWPRHIDWVGETFGDLIAGWVPQREPILQAMRRFWLGSAPPGKVDGLRLAKAIRDTMLADGEAWRLLRGTAPVAAHHTARLIVADTEDPTAGPQARSLERLAWHPWIGALTEGRLQVGELPEQAVDHLRDAFDRVVVQLRPSIRVDGTGRWLPHPADRRPGPAGLVAWPEAMAAALARVTDELEGRSIIAAGDLGDVIDDGRTRPDHQQAMIDLVGDLDLAGWWQTSPIDGYHFSRGFGLQPGLITVDRTETPAAETYRTAARAARSGPIEEDRSR